MKNNYRLRNNTTNRLRNLLLTAVIVACIPSLGRATEKTAAAAEPHSVLHQVGMYIPNRLLDAWDIARLRLRIGPGIAADVRVTKLVSAFLGAYGTVYAGLPGPRNGPMPKLPVGFESRNGAQLSIVDVTAEGDVGPDYGPAEIGLGLQVLIVGFDAGVEPWELLDFAAGLFFIDLRDDDL